MTFSKVMILFICLLPFIMAASISANNPHPTFRRDRRAIQARLAATAEDHVSHAAMKLKMMNEGRARRAANPTRVKRFISPSEGVLPYKAAQKGYAANAGRYEPVQSGSGPAADIVNRIQHGANPPQTGSNQLSNKIFQDLLMRERKDNQRGESEERPDHNIGNQKPSARERDDFMRIMQELGVMEYLGNDFDKSQKDSKNGKNEGKDSAANFVNQRLHSQSHHNEINPLPNRDDVKVGLNRNGQMSASGFVNHRMARPAAGGVASKRDFPMVVGGADDLDAELGDGVKEEAVIDIGSKALSKTGEGKLTLSSVDLEVIRSMLEEIVAKHHQK